MTEDQALATINSTLYDLFEQLVFDCVDQGFENYSARTLLHVAKWKLDCGNAEDGKRVSLNHNHIGNYVRYFIRCNPQHAYFFKLRGEKSGKLLTHLDRSNEWEKAVRP